MKGREDEENKNRLEKPSSQRRSRVGRLANEKETGNECSSKAKKKYCFVWWNRTCGILVVQPKQEEVVISFTSQHALYAWLCLWGSK